MTSILQRVLDLANGIQGAVLQFERHPEGGARPSFPVRRCTKCPPASFGSVWTDEYAAAGGTPKCDHPDTCCWDSASGCAVYANLLDRFQHIDWCDSPGPYMAPGCSCPCPCDQPGRETCPRHLPEETYFVDETGEYGPERPGL